MKKLKYILGGIASVISLFCICLFVVKPLAAEGNEVLPETPVEEVVVEEETETTDPTTQLFDEETQKKIEEALEIADAVSKGDYKALKNTLYASVGVGATLIIVACFILLRLTLKRVRDNKMYKEATARLNAENKAKLEAQADLYDAKLKSLEDKIILKLAQNDAEKKAEYEARAKDIADKLEEAAKTFSTEEE